MGYLANCSPSPFGEGWGEAAFYLPLLSERDGERLFGDMFRLFSPTLSYPMNSIPTWKTSALTTQARSVV